MNFGYYTQSLDQAVDECDGVITFAQAAEAGVPKDAFYRYVKEKGLLMVQDDALLGETILRVLAENTQSVADFKGGKDRAFGFLVGQTMKAMKGKAAPGKVNERLRQALEKK